MGEDLSIRPDSLPEGFAQQVVGRRNGRFERGKWGSAPRREEGGCGRGGQHVTACTHTSCPGAEQQQALPRPGFYMSVEQQVGKPHFWYGEVAVTLPCLRMPGFPIKQGPCGAHQLGAAV